MANALMNHLDPVASVPSCCAFYLYNTSARLCSYAVRPHYDCFDVGKEQFKSMGWPSAQSSARRSVCRALVAAHYEVHGCYGVSLADCVRDHMGGTDLYQINRQYATEAHLDLVVNFIFTHSATLPRHDGGQVTIPAITGRLLRSADFFELPRLRGKPQDLCCSLLVSSISC